MEIFWKPRDGEWDPVRQRRIKLSIIIMPIREIVLSTLLEKATIKIGILYTVPYQKKMERRI